MSESNNVKFVENDGKWMWKRYDENGSVIFKSAVFDTERGARENYEAIGGEPTPSAVTSAPVETAPEQTAPATSQEETSAGTAAPEGDLGAGSAAPDQGTDQANTNA